MDHKILNTENLSSQLSCNLGNKYHVVGIRSSVDPVLTNEKHSTIPHYFFRRNGKLGQRRKLR